MVRTILVDPARTPLAHAEIPCANYWDMWRGKKGHHNDSRNQWALWNWEGGWNQHIQCTLKALQSDRVGHTVLSQHLKEKQEWQEGRVAYIGLYITLSLWLSTTMILHLPLILFQAKEFYMAILFEVRSWNTLQIGAQLSATTCSCYCCLSHFLCNHTFSRACQ